MSYPYQKTPQETPADVEAISATVVERPVGMIESFLGPTNGKSHLYLGCCCDSRRAVIIMNSITIVVSFILGLLFFISVRLYGSEIKDSIINAVDDDEAEEAFEGMDDDAFNAMLATFLSVFEVFMLFAIIIHGFGVYGAIKYKRWAVIIAALSYGLPFAGAVFQFQIVPVIIGALFLYPHVVFLDEMKKGIMTEYNYPNVATCCG